MSSWLSWFYSSEVVPLSSTPTKECNNKDCNNSNGKDGKNEEIHCPVKVEIAAVIMPGESEKDTNTPPLQETIPGDSEKVTDAPSLQETIPGESEKDTIPDAPSLEEIIPGDSEKDTIPDAPSLEEIIPGESSTTEKYNNEIRNNEKCVYNTSFRSDSSYMNIVRKEQTCTEDKKAIENLQLEFPNFFNWTTDGMNCRRPNSDDDHIPYERLQVAEEYHELQPFGSNKEMEQEEGLSCVRDGKYDSKWNYWRQKSNEWEIPSPVSLDDFDIPPPVPLDDFDIPPPVPPLDDFDIPPPVPPLDDFDIPPPVPLDDFDIPPPVPLDDFDIPPPVPLTRSYGGGFSVADRLTKRYSYFDENVDFGFGVALKDNNDDIADNLKEKDTEDNNRPSTEKKINLSEYYTSLWNGDDGGTEQDNNDPYTDDPYIEDPYIEDPYIEDPYVDDLEEGLWENRKNVAEIDPKKKKTKWIIYGFHGAHGCAEVYSNDMNELITAIASYDVDCELHCRNGAYLCHDIDGQRQSGFNWTYSSLQQGWSHRKHKMRKSEEEQQRLDELEDLQNTIMNRYDDIEEKTTKIILIGTGSGAIVAAEVAFELKKNYDFNAVDGLILVNPTRCPQMTNKEEILNDIPVLFISTAQHFETQSKKWARKFQHSHILTAESRLNPLVDFNVVELIKQIWVDGDDVNEDVGYSYYV
jgi:predicted esterase